MSTESELWERKVCLTIGCVLDMYHVRRVPELPETWLVAEAPGLRPMTEAATAPFCPRCGENLIEAPRQGFGARGLAVA